ncbi:type II toxin-antitoxin system RelE/ParE family toxin [Pseudopedobacter beijingensis]|uniref:Toxin n=1 Tax=Pseudopedobacter beijingensis TaxID=1207056 RepID=A0ABW4IED2_9SPHI
MAFYLTKLAKTDLIDIGHYIQQKWGVRQRNIYLSALDHAFHFLESSPESGKPCDEIRPGYFKYRVHKHIIFYRKVAEKSIEIVRVLHGNTDTGKQFQ